MSNYGFHYGKCHGDGDAKAILTGAGILVGMLAVEWVATNAVAILAVTAACGALAVAAVVALMHWTDRRGAAFAARLAAGRERATLTATVTPQVSQPAQMPAIETHYHIHFDPADRDAARVIRTALPGLAEGVHRQGEPT